MISEDKKKLVKTDTIQKNIFKPKKITKLTTYEPCDTTWRTEGVSMYEVCNIIVSIYVML